MFPFRPDQKITDYLKSRPFTLSAEVIPPRNGAEQAKVLAQVQTLCDSGAEFLAVTKGAGGSLRGGSLPIAQVIKEQFGRPCIAHFTCRDLTPHDVENQLMDHHYFGIRNILALRGDPPDGQPEWRPREGGYSYAHELIAQIKNLNAGRYLPRAGGPTVDTQERTDFCIGAAVYPEHADEANRIEYFRQKVDAGAEYGITDMLFDVDAYARFLDGCAKAGIDRIPVLPGTRLLKTRAGAEKMAQKFKVSIPQATLNALPETSTPEKPAPIEPGLEVFLRMVERLKRVGAPGVHLFVIADTAGAKIVLEKLR
jgi:methylenetetrahydrofolate reductase (NADPH)